MKGGKVKNDIGRKGEREVKGCYEDEEKEEKEIKKRSKGETEQNNTCI